MEAIAPQTNRRNFILMLVVFSLPILLAKLALEFKWLDYGVTNEGQLIDQPLTIADFDIDPSTVDKQWLLTYLVDENCESHCQNRLLGINNTYIALGKEIPRVTPVAMLKAPLTDQQTANIRERDWRFQSASKKTLSNMQQGLLYVVDPLGNIILTHKIPDNNEGIPAFGKAVVADMKKLLKYSKVG